MLTAYSISEKQIVHAERSTKEAGEFHCPACGASLILRKGLVRIHHFAHQATSTCRYRGESQLHLAIKKSIYISLIQELGERVKTIELEQHLTGARPDVYVEGHKKKIAIEVQVSSLTATEIIRRTAHYHQLGVYVLWVLPFDSDRMIGFDKIEQKEQFKPIRLKEYERILMRMYFSNLMFWDVKQKWSEQFIVAQLADTWTAASEYYSIDWSTTLQFDPKRLKSKKIPTQIKYNVGLKDFQCVPAQKFKMPKANYYLPRRLIVNYKW